MRAEKTIYPITARDLQARIHARHPQFDLVGLAPDETIPTPITDLVLRCREHGVEFRSRPAYLLHQRAAKSCFCHVCEPCSKRTYYPQLLRDQILPTRCRQPLALVDTRFGPYEPISSNTPIEVECRAPLPDGVVCGHRWRARLANLLSGYGCPACYRRRHKVTRTLSADDLNTWLPTYGLRAEQRRAGQVLLRCPSGHRFSKLLGDVQALRRHLPARAARRRVCPTCRRRLAYYQHRREAARRGFILDATSREWKGKGERYAYRCARGHVHRRSPIALDYWRHGCPQCRAEDRSQQALAELGAWVAERGGVLLPGQTYRTCEQKLACRCADGHRFHISRDKLKQGGWCPVCSSGFGERLTRHIMEHIFNAPFPRARPEFLRNEQTGKRLELDGYNARLAVAFEYQGRQHQQRTHGWHPTMRDYLDARARDALKRRLTRSYGVRLVEVQQLDPGLPLAAVFDHIEAACRAAGIQIVPYSRRLDLAPVYRGSRNRVRFERRVREQGGQQLDPYIGLQRHVRLRCHRPEHPPWSVTPFSVLYAHTWCPRCGAEATGASVRRRYYRRMLALTAQHGMQLLDGPYRGPTHPHRWQCPHGHEVIGTFRALAARLGQGRMWCSTCAAAQQASA